MSTKKHSVLNIAHRGARSLAPENTLLAARKGLEVGADWWELDVAMTSDGELVVVHDDSLERTSNVAARFPQRAPWLIHTFCLAELRQLDFGSWYNDSDPFGQIAAGRVSPDERRSFIGAQIPTLQETLEFTRSAGWRVNVEIKDASGTPGDADLPEKVAAMIRRMDMVQDVLVSSFNHAYIRRVKAVEPRLVTAALVEEAADDPVALLRETGAQAYNPCGLCVDADTIRKVRTAGYDVYVWTVNEPENMRQLIAAGVSGIFTDFPQRLAEILAE